jgi:tRNA threonylcarbamoyl adenosine modification protein YeaZ
MGVARGGGLAGASFDVLAMTIRASINRYEGLAMNVLALDTAGPDPGVAVFVGGSVFEQRLPQDRHASERLLSAVALCLDDAGVALEACDRIAICSGPGSFTGLRIGLSTAWGLGRALKIPVEAVSTLEALAEAARAPGVGRVTAALDAGRGEVVIESFTLDGARARSLGPPRRISREEAVRSAGPEGIVSLPGNLLAPYSRAPSGSVSHALALAVSAAPRDEAVAEGYAPQAAYSRPSAAEEKRGTS